MINKNNKNKILLINPKLTNAEYFWLPLGLAYIASYLEKYSFQVKTMDANVLRIDGERVVDFINEKPDIIGITAMTPNIYSAWEIAKRAKKKFPNVLIVLGGHHPSVLPEESLKKEYIDIIIIGEGEKAMKEIAESVRNNSYNFENIDGAVYKTKFNKIKYNRPRSPIENLDELPFPAWHLFDFPSKYTPNAYRQLPVASIFTSRGCPHRCTYCHFDLFGKRFRPRSPESVILEIEYLKNNFNIKEFHITDDNFALDQKRAMEFCDLLIKRKINLPWACVGGIRVDTVVRYPFLIEKMKQTGFYRTSIGIESGSQKILNNIQKGTTIEQVEETVKILKRNKITVGGYFMIGNYGEDKETVEETIQLAKKLPLDYAQIMIATPYPGTKFYQQVKEEGRFLTKKWDEFNIFTGAVFEWDNLSKKQIDRLYEEAYSRYYFRPMFILKSLAGFKIRNWKIYLNGSVLLFKNLIRKRTI